MTTPATEIPPVSPEARLGIWYLMPARDSRYEKEIQRAADDGTGSPDGTTWTTIAIVAGTTTRYRDVVFPGAGRKHYRHRFVGGNLTTPGDWSATSDALPFFQVDVRRTGADIPRADDDCRKVGDQLGEVIKLDPQESDFDSDGTVEGRLTATVISPSGLYDLQFETRQGRGTGWTAATLVEDQANGDSASVDVDLVEKENSFIAVEVFDADTNISLGRTVVTFDPDRVAEVDTPAAAIDEDDGSVLVEASGDVDTANIYITVGEDSDPADPTAGANDASVSGRSGSVDTGVTIARQSVAHVKAVGANSAGELGPVATAKVTRGGTPATELPTIDIEPARNDTPFVRKFRIVGAAGPDGTQSNVEVAWRLDREPTGDKGALSGWQSSPVTVAINMREQGLTWGRGAILVARARDTTPSTPLESKGFAYQKVESLLGPRDGPSFPKGPTDEQAGRDGLGGESPGGQQVRTPVHSAGGDRMVDVGGRRFGNATVQSSVLIGSGVQVSDGAVALPSMKGQSFSSDASGAVSFPQNFSQIPGIQPLFGWVTQDTSLSGKYAPQVRISATASGFDWEAVLVQSGFTVTSHSVNFSPDTISGVGINGDDYSAEMSDDTTQVPWDLRVTFVLDMQAFAVRTGFTQDGGLICDGGSITIGLYSNDGSGPVLRETVSISAECFDTAVVEKEVSVGLPAGFTANPSGPEFLTGIVAETGQGGDYTAKTAEWETASTNETSATPGSQQLSFAVNAKEDAS